MPGSFGGSIFATGPAQGTLGVTSLVLTNLTPDPQRVEIFQPILRSNALDCGGGVQGTGGPGSIDMILNLQPNQTLSLPFPSPLVFTPIDGHSCIAMSINGTAVDAVRAYVTGFVN